ncbi:DMT family transporter [Rhodovibrio salinarum]|uniref:EamA/RhaT family transporter n=1 Tax=Rhodovibrio salinarum TaxID=1087 RepID=A0A934V1B1_9PROT|nr:DMT family transporter [Rhodovibrio salinarum]MBK1697979.1 EamA/RhaT family transporter [Rhodovibrio salinarum]
MAWISVPSARAGGPTLGIAAIVVAVFLLSFSDALVKLAGDRFGLGQLVLLRSLVAAGLLAGAVFAMSGAAALYPKRPGWVCTRSLCLAAMWLSYYAALPALSFALAAACYYSSPVWMALIARFALHVPIGGRGWLAIALSLAGVILTVDPQPGNVSPLLLLPLAAAGFYALAGIITWRRCQDETAGAMALNLNITLCAVAGLWLVALAVASSPEKAGFVLAFWPELSASDWFLVVLLGVLLAIIAMAVALAYRLAPTPIVGVFDTAYLGFAALWGALLFADMPTPQEGAGICMILAGAILISLRAPRGKV